MTERTAERVELPFGLAATYVLRHRPSPSGPWHGQLADLEQDDEQLALPDYDGCPF